MTVYISGVHDARVPEEATWGTADPPLLLRALSSGIHPSQHLRK